MASDQLDLRRHLEKILAHPKYEDRKRLSRFGYKVYSQNDEDGILAEIFTRIGVKHRTFVEFGIGNGLECNSLWLLVQGWSGLWIDSCEQSVRNIGETHRPWTEDNSLRVTSSFITRENINSLIAEAYAGEIDLLSVDIDFNDYWVWEAISIISPRVVCIEYNATWVPPVAISVPYDAAGKWNGSNYFGASLSALAALGERKGYDLVGCCIAGVNAFFVRKELVGEHFFAPGSAKAHYEPPRYQFAGLAAGHPPSIGPIVHISSSPTANATSEKGE